MRLRWFLLGSITAAVVGYVIARRPPIMPDVVDVDGAPDAYAQCGEMASPIGGPGLRCVRPQGHVGWHADKTRHEWLSVDPVPVVADRDWLDRGP